MNPKLLCQQHCDAIQNSKLTGPIIKTGTGHKFASKNNCWFFATDISLQNLCLEKLSNWLKSTSDIDTHPLPAKLKFELKHRLFGE